MDKLSKKLKNKHSLFKLPGFLAKENLLKIYQNIYRTLLHFGATHDVNTVIRKTHAYSTRKFIVCVCAVYIYIYTLIYILMYMYTLSAFNHPRNQRNSVKLTDHRAQIRSPDFPIIKQECTELSLYRVARQPTVVLT
jgi:hypothetical protein